MVGPGYGVANNRRFRLANIAYFLHLLFTNGRKIAANAIAKAFYFDGNDRPVFVSMQKDLDSMRLNCWDCFNQENFASTQAFCDCIGIDCIVARPLGATRKIIR